ncbi:class II aldolase [Pelagibius litoralis]|uniref:Class II aldolase n=1 Tax=Pelagibius litoralis TaxID=374515 RepID=A0A967K8Y0_9PROT|nr:class II aldolase/adducin family protein [Pelagibius litoralis]NIA70693.1 class II aldolase [Pelagibius litoralis]
MAALKHLTLRKAIIAACLKMNELGINQGTSGNISARIKGGFLITPSGIPYEKMKPEQIVEMDLGGGYFGNFLPSSEWRMHYDIYLNKPEGGAVVHTHAVYCTALACLHERIPAFHYMIGVAGGTNIRCADYATFGTQELSGYMLKALQDRSACLLANHGMICFAKDLDKTLWLAGEVETLAQQYWTARQMGKPTILSKREMATVLARFKSYGKQSKDLAKGEALAVEPPPRRDGPQAAAKAPARKNVRKSAAVRKPAARKRAARKTSKAKEPAA